MFLDFPLINVTIWTREQGDVTVLYVDGPMHYDIGGSTLGKDIEKLIAQGKAKIVIDCSRAKIHSEVVEELVRLKKKAQSIPKGDIKLLQVGRGSTDQWARKKIKQSTLENLDGTEDAAVDSFLY